MKICKHEAFGILVSTCLFGESERPEILQVAVEAAVRRHFAVPGALNGGAAEELLGTAGS